jgi:hypothetical protein
MIFVNRIQEMDRLEDVWDVSEGGLVVVYGRRRIGKTRLLLEWARKRDGLYTVADQSAPEIQRRYLAQAIAVRVPGFSEVEYPDWFALLRRLAREAAALGWRGPLVFDEVPYLVSSSPELPSVLQRWVDNEARQAALVVALAGSSQRMMQGLALSANAPLYGRASALLDIGPLDPSYLADAFGRRDPADLVELHVAWGGVPRYWELAKEVGGSVADQIDYLVLDPLGPLHLEPDRLLLQELPPAVETKPVLDAIGAGAHRVSEIASRLGRPATSMSRPLERLVGMGLVRREVPFGEPERTSRRSLYKIDDPFFRLWFRVVAPHRGQLAAGSRAARLGLLKKSWPLLASQGWEELCRLRLPKVGRDTRIGGAGPWGPASRWWHGNEPEWDVLSRSLDGKSVLLGEVKWSAAAFGRGDLERAAVQLARRPVPPTVPPRTSLVHALFVPAVDGSGAAWARRRRDVIVVTAGDMLL